MAKPIVHAESSARQFGGVAEDYLPIHDLMDSSKGAIPDNRHRALTHTSWFLSTILERIFGPTITNADGKRVSVRAIGEQHIREDYGGIIPTAQDFLAVMDLEPWMSRGPRGPVPPSAERVAARSRHVRTDGD